MCESIQCYMILFDKTENIHKQDEVIFLIGKTF